MNVTMVIPGERWAEPERRRLFGRNFRSARLLLPEFLAVATFVALIWLSIWLALSGEHRSARREAMHDSALLARTFADNAGRIVGGIDNTLLALRTAYAADPEHFDGDAWIEEQNRRDHLQAQIGLIGPDGIVMYSSVPGWKPINVADREHFRVQLDSTKDALFISKPIYGRVTGIQQLQFTRKILRKDGSFGGVVVVSLDCAKLSEFYHGMDIDGTVLLVGLDGIVRAQGAGISAEIGRDLGRSRWFQTAVDPKTSSNATWAADPGDVIVGFQRLDRYPLLVAVGFDGDHIFGGYKSQRVRWVVAGLMASMVVLLLGYFWMQQRLRSIASRRALITTLGTVSQGIAMVDSKGRIPVLNNRALELLDVDPAAAQGSSELLRSRLEDVATTNPDGDGVIERGGKVIEVKTHRTPYGDSVVTYTDVTERTQNERRMRQLALYDRLTGLANRELLSLRLAEALQSTRRNSPAFALMALDLDGFKSVNDSLGHDVGDLVLKIVGERLSASVRREDTVARFGGDEFMILLRRVRSEAEVERIASKLLACLSEPVNVQGHLCRVGASVGSAVSPRDGMCETDLLKNADIALYAAKADGRAQHKCFQPSMRAAIEERRWLENEMRGAIQKGEITVEFQPQVDCQTLQISGFEALARWRHPERGNISPAAFIPIAEDCGLVVQLGRSILRQACEHAARWQGEYRVAVNLSPVQFRDAGLPALIRNILSETGLKPSLLELEITEGVLIHDEEIARKTLNELRASGIQVALDDFGTGYSSLSYLRSFPFDRVKIDKSFVQSHACDTKARAILDGILFISRSLGLAITAEGVETTEQFEAVKQRGCTDIQGYLFSPPMSPEEAAHMVANIHSGDKIQVPEPVRQELVRQELVQREHLLENPEHHHGTGVAALVGAAD